MTLPKETIEAIQKRSIQYAEHEWTPLSPDCPDWMTNARDYQAGATEWAGKVKGLIDALEFCALPANHSDPDLALYARQEAASRALAKYKEVTNER